MNFTKVVSLLLFLIVFGAELSAQPAIDFTKNKNTNFFDIRKKYNEYWVNEKSNDESGWKKFKRWEYFWETRVMPDGSFPDAIDIINELSEFKKQTPEIQTAPKWLNIGPNSNPKAYKSGVGRVNVIRIKPDDYDVIWLGAASGGVWHSSNRGKTWDVFDFTEALSIGISDIAFCESNPKVAYVATGDADGIGAAFSTYSSGIIKTTDDGKTWNFTNINYALANGKIVGAITVHPKNPDLVLAATSNGIYKTTDGGKTWNAKSSAGYFRKFTQHIDNPNIILATTFSGSRNAAIYRSTDFGETWTKVQALSGVRRAEIKFAASEPDYAYVLCTSGTIFRSVWKSVDAGKTWKRTASINNTPNILGRDLGKGKDKTVGQGWYDLALAVSPGNQNEIYTGGVNIWRSTDGGITFSMLTHWTGGYHKPYVHADIHCLEFDINTGKFYCGSDGGIDYSDNPASKWINLNKGLAITQYYKIAVAQNKPDFIYGGSQDNGTHQYNAGTWKRVYGGDGMDCAVDYKDYKRAIISMYYGSFFRTRNGRSFSKVLDKNKTHEQGAWVTPLLINPVNPFSYYAGFKNLWKSVDGGSHWSKSSNLNIGTLLNMAISKKDTNVIYVSTFSVLSKSTDGGITFTTIPGAHSPIKGITIDDNNPHRIWIAVGGFSKSSKVFMYDGKKWTNMSGNIPNVPVNCIVYQNNSPDRLYIGTDLGLMFSDYNSGYWQFWGSGMPNLIISDIEIDYANSKLYASSYGRGVWKTDLNTCNVAQPKIQVEGNTEICKGTSVKLTAETNSNNILWSTGEKTKSIIVRKEGIYSYSLPDIGNCPVRSKSVIIKVFSVPNLKIKPFGNYPVCKGDEFNLSLSASFGFKSYVWSTGEKKRKIKIATPGKYSLVATTRDGCTVNVEIVIKVYDKPAKPIITRWSGTKLISSPADAYQWYLDNAELSGETKRELNITKIGTYRVEVFNKNKCSNMSDSLKIISSVDDKTQDAIALYPNPTNNKLTIDLSNSGLGKTKLIMSDLIGNIIYRKSLSAATEIFNIDMSEFDAGVYFIKIICANKTIFRRIIKQ